MSAYYSRIIKAGFINFTRNGWVTLATVMIMVITLFVIGSIMLSNVLLVSVLTRIEKKVDVSIYLKTTAQEEDILILKSKLENLPEVDEIRYTTREEALSSFMERHKNNALITQSLDELGDNPLGASLNVHAKNSEQYESVAMFLSSPAFSSIIDKINYFQNKIVIERLSNILTTSRRAGFGISLVLAVIAVLVAFNTIRLAIYTSKDEISVMLLVGAKNSFIRGPFIVEGILYGIISAFVTMVAFYPLTLWLGPKAEFFFGGLNLFEYYISNFFQFFIILLFIGTILGSFSSFIAIRRYLKV